QDYPRSRGHLPSNAGLDRATISRSVSALLLILVCAGSFLVRLPLHINQVRMKGVCLFLRHPGLDPRPAGRAAVFRHTALLVTAAQHDRVEAPMNTERHVAEIRHFAIKRPRAAAIGLRRMALLTEELVVHPLTLLNLLGTGRLWRRLRHRGNVRLN